MENVDIELLIHLVKGFPYLYDKSDKSYKDIVKKENAWKAIAEGINCSGKVFNLQKIFINT